MSNDDDRPRRQAEQLPTDRPRRCQPGDPRSEPVYVSVLEAFQPPPGQNEDIGRRTSGSSRSVPAKAKARLRTRRFMTNGRPLRLLPGGRQSGEAAGADQAGANRAGGAGRPDPADETARPDQEIQPDLAGQADLADRFSGLGPAPSGLAGQAPAARYRLQLLLPPDDDASQQAAGRSGGRSGGQSDRSEDRNVPEHSPPSQRDRQGGPGQSNRAGNPGQGNRAGNPGQPGSHDDHPDRYDQPGPNHHLGQPLRRTSHYLASTWEYAGARALATAGRHRHREHAERRRSARTALTQGESRALWAAQYLSSAGDLIAQVAIAIGVYDRTRSPFLTALAYALTYLPSALGGRLPGRPLARIAPRTVMIGLDLARAGLVTAIALAGLPLPWLCLLLLGVMLLGAPHAAARTALLRNAQPAEQRPGSFSSGASGALSWQATQALGFLLGAAAVAVLQPRRVLLIDAATFLVSACLLTVLVRHRPAEPPPAGARAGEIAATGPGVAAILRSNPVLRTLLLFGWLAGCYVVPEGLAVPYAHALGGGPLTVGLLMAAMPAGAVAGIIVFTRATPPEARTQLLGWLAMLCCMPLAFCSLRPPLWVVLILWALAGAGTAYQLVIAAAVGQAIRDDLRPGALQMAQSGLVAAQALGFVAAGAVAEFIGPQAAVALAGLLGLTAAAVLARIWDRQQDRLVWARRASATVVHDQPAVW
jgi:predicted MFS family arabinose efflux permease